MNQLKKKCKVVILATENKEKALKGYKDKSLLFNYNSNLELIHSQVIKEYIQHYHLYILSEDEIKEGDWFIDLDIPHQAKPHKALKSTDLTFVNHRTKLCFKIIATTDSSLSPYIKSEYDFNEVTGGQNYYHLPSIPQSFIEKYIEQYNKGNIITEVMIEYEEICERGCLNFEECPQPSWCDIINKLKLRKDNTIIISKVKDSWNREEVKDVLASFLSYIHFFDGELIDKWFDEQEF